LAGSGDRLSTHNTAAEQQIFYPHFDCRIFVHAAAFFGEPRLFDL